LAGRNFKKFPTLIKAAALAAMLLPTSQMQMQYFGLEKISRIQFHFVSSASFVRIPALTLHLPLNVSATAEKL
jgi:hypothetical protein